MRILALIGLLVTSLFAGGYSAFIQSPIPPNSKVNYLYDNDKDGRMDQMSIRFLGTLTDEYVHEMLDSLTFEWLNKDGELVHYSVPSQAFRVNPENERLMLVDFDQNRFWPLTGLSTQEFSLNSYKNLKLYQNGGAVYSLYLRDGMAPTLRNANFRGYRGKAQDTLWVELTEEVRPVEYCEAYLEYKSEKDGEIHVLPASVVEWKVPSNRAQFIFDPSISLDGYLTPRDSLRIMPNCVKDSSGNMSSDSATFIPVKGFYPLELYTQDLVYDDGDESLDRSVFSFGFSPAYVEEKAKSAWSLGIDLFGTEFETALRDMLALGKNEDFDRSKLMVAFDVKIYTNLGTYVVGTSAKLEGDDSRFLQDGTRLTLNWNLMDDRHRRVATGVYLADVSVKIVYGGDLVFQNLVPGKASSVYTFGVKRR